ncbi:hypothetical protein [Asaia bogorensis]|uniref:hypothetical protein n=1 Tax=Asaia bogorensis TaxID=91915 RepID=UPI000EFD8948|nr:hypothetical protein [Asaia bogorensis]
MEGDAIPVSLTHINRVAYPSISLFGRRFFSISMAMIYGRLHRRGVFTLSAGEQPAASETTKNVI